MEWADAYRQRMERNTQLLAECGEWLKARNLIVRRPMGANFSFIVVTDQERTKSITVEFREVPYRWALSIGVDPSGGNGSSRTINESVDYQRFPWTAKEIEQSMGTYYKKWDNPYLVQL